MSTDPTRLMKAIGALIVLGILAFVVSGYWGDFKSASKAPKPVETTATPDATATADATEPAKPAQASQSKQASPIIVIKIDGLNFREEAKPDGKPIRGLKKGDQLSLVKTEGSWYLVQDADGTQGYISANPNYTTIKE